MLRWFLICALVALLTGCANSSNHNLPDAAPAIDARPIDARPIDARPIDAANVEPVLVDDNLSAVTNVNNVLDVLGNDMSLGNAPWIITIESSTPSTTVYYRTENPDQGKVWYKTALPSDSVDTFTYTATDHDGQHMTAHVQVNIVSAP